MNRSVQLAWDIISGLIALYVCYELIFVDEMTKTGKLAMALFFISLVGKRYIGRRSGNN